MQTNLILHHYIFHVHLKTLLFSYLDGMYFLITDYHYTG